MTWCFSIALIIPLIITFLEYFTILGQINSELNTLDDYRSWTAYNKTYIVNLDKEKKKFYNEST